MALKTYLTGIADAIRTKKGTTDPINAQNFASEIESIESGGGLTGYSPNTSNLTATFRWGLLEDGTYTTTLSADNKYIYCYVDTDWGDIDETINCTKVWGGTGVALCQITSDGWYITAGGGGISS